MDVPAIIAALGGPRKIAEALSRASGAAYRANSVFHWTRRGVIPAYLTSHLAAMAVQVSTDAATPDARARAAAVTFETLSRHNKPRMPRRNSQATQLVVAARAGAAE